MAIKTSNQITFTEQKKVVRIEEWYLATKYDTDVKIEDGDWGTWTQEIQTINADNPYLWNYEKVVYSLGDPEISEPIIIGFYSQGSEGKSIVSIKNYYQLTTDTNPPTSWQDTVPMLDPVNRYLWNYEEITYNIGEPTITDPAIIGVYGDSGTDSVNFQIYSVDGFEFNKNLTSITLQTVAFQGGESIESKASYVWKWWKASDNKYETISDATSSTLTVNITDEYALVSLKCEMTYDGKVYEDYVTLTEKVTVYTSVVKFFNGTNVFKTTDEYLIAYMALYENGAEIDGLLSDVCIKAKSLNGNTILANIPDEYKDRKYLYFIVSSSANKYQIILGECFGSSWRKVDMDYLHDYNYKSYQSGDYIGSTKIVAISRYYVDKTALISFEACRKGDSNNAISTADGNVIDLNDPVVSSSPPSNPVEGQLWLDTSSVPYVLKICKIDDDGKVTWVESSQQIGGAVYTSRPSTYSINDIWILNEDEVCAYTGSNGIEHYYGPGSMLISSATVPTTANPTFQFYHWTEIKSDLTDMRDNVAQYFEFNADTGLKIGQKDKKFYVNIDSQEMGFYDNSNSLNPNKKVVSIGNQSAKIRNATMEESAKFNCNTDFNSKINMHPSSEKTTGFTWQFEADGSLSLITIK